MKKAMLGVFALLISASILVQSGSDAKAEDKYPSKQINWYIHASAGGGTDVFSRTAALRLRRILKTPIVVATMSGGGGARMLNYLMEQPADGYSITSFVNTNLAAVVRGMTKAKPHDLIGIARGCYDPVSFIVSSGGRFKTIQEVVKYGKANPRKIKFAITQMASVDHVAAYTFAKEAGFIAEYVPFKSGGEVIVSVIGGIVDIGVVNPSEFIGQYEAGNVKPVVFLVSDRLKDFPKTPTAKELGWNVEMATWRGVVVKAGTPKPIVDKLRKAFAGSMGHSIYQSYLKSNSMGPDSVQTGDEWQAFLDANFPVWESAMKELGYIK